MSGSILTQKYNREFIRAYFSIIRDRASSTTPIHRAKAMKLAMRLDDDLNRLLNKNERESFWEQIKKEEWLRLSSMGYIESLGDKAEIFLKSEGL